MDYKNYSSFSDTNEIFTDISKAINDTIGVAQNIGDNFNDAIKDQLIQLLQNCDVVFKDDLTKLKLVIQKITEENNELKKKLDNLEYKVMKFKK